MAQNGTPDKGMSERGWSNVAGIMPRIAAAVEERTRQDNPNIDLSTAENWLIRPELIELCKNAISSNLSAQVRERKRVFFHIRFCG